MCMAKLFGGYCIILGMEKVNFFHKKDRSNFRALQPTEVIISEKVHFLRQMGSEVWVNARERKNPLNLIFLHPIYSF